MNQDKLQEHVFSTYISLRYGVAVISFVFPFLLVLIGYFLYGINIELTMSHYYFSISPGDHSQKEFPMRIWFVGILFAIGVFLYLYKGFSSKENIALNIAGFSALLIAIFPLDNCIIWYKNIHGISAFSLFIAIIYVCLACKEDSLKHLENLKLKARYRIKYNIIGFLMISLLLSVILLNFLFNNLEYIILILETICVCIFAIYWWVKSNELSQSKAELICLNRK